MSKPWVLILIPILAARVPNISPGIHPDSRSLTETPCLAADVPPVPLHCNPPPTHRNRGPQNTLYSWELRSQFLPSEKRQRPWPARKEDMRHLPTDPATLCPRLLVQGLQSPASAGKTLPKSPCDCGPKGTADRGQKI